jgi:hypothetical protein
MLSEITCDTPIDNIIKESDVTAILDNYKDTLVTYQNIIKDGVNNEISNGGLAIEGAYVIDDIAPLYTKANKLLDKVDDCSKYYQDFYDAAIAAFNKQRTMEITTMKNAVSNKIEKLQQAVKGKLTESVTSSFVTNPNIKTELDALMGEVQSYQDKLDTLQSMLGIGY